MPRLKDVLAILDLEEWLSQYAETKPMNRSDMIRLNCPVCGNEKFKLYVNVDDKIWFCQRCDWGRGINDPCILMAEVSGRHINDIKIELSRMAVPTPTEGFADKLRNVLFKTSTKADAVIIESIELPGNNNFTSHTGDKVFKYALERGLTAEEIKAYDLFVAAKLRNINGPFLCFPVIWDTIPVDWQGRRISDNEPRYVSGDDIGHYIWPISAAFMKKIQETKALTLVEGVFDAIALWRFGIAAACTFGKKITSRQIALIKNLGVTHVTLAWDKDARREIEEAAQKLKTSFFVKIAVLEPPEEYDVVRNGKFDAGKTLLLPEWGQHLVKTILEAFDVYGEAFFKWRLQRRLS